MKKTKDDLMFLLDFGRFLNSREFAGMEEEVKNRYPERELEDDDLEAVSAAGETVFLQIHEEDGHGY